MKTSPPEAVGISSQRLTRLGDWLRQQVTSKRLAGCSVLLCRKGREAFFDAAGLSAIEASRSFDRETVVRIFSMTKPITTVAAMMLYEEGCFQLDDPVSRYIPAFSEMTVWQGGSIDNVVPARSPITIKQLMTHTSGLTYGFMHASVVDARYRELLDSDPDMPLNAWAELLATIPLLCEPGSQWNYSVSTDLLGRLIEVWSGQTLEAFFEQRIFSMLGMSDTGFHVKPANHDRFAALYGPASGVTLATMGQQRNRDTERAPDIKLLESAERSRYLAPATHFSGGGGLVSTIADYARFCQMMLSGGAHEGQRLLSPKTVGFMMRNHLPDGRDMAAMGQPIWSETSYDGIGFGLGGAVVLDPVKAQTITSAGEYHWGGAASTFFWIDPVEELYVVFLTQLLPSSTYPIRRELRTRVYQALVG